MHDFVLLDTDVASYLFKKSPRAPAFRALLEGKQTALAFVSVAELFRWTVKRRWSEPKVEQLKAALRRYVIIPYDFDLAWAWARLTTTCEEAGRAIAPSDAWVAACALRHHVPLVTNNTKHYEAAEHLCGLQLRRPQP